MATEKELRAAIMRCAEGAAKTAGDSDARASNFVARLSGSLASLGEHELDAAVWGVFEPKAAPGAARTDGA